MASVPLAAIASTEAWIAERGAGSGCVQGECQLAAAVKVGWLHAAGGKTHTHIHKDNTTPPPHTTPINTVVELHKDWAGPCKPIAATLRALSYALGDSSAKFLTVRGCWLRMPRARQQHAPLRGPTPRRPVVQQSSFCWACVCRSTWTQCAWTSGSWMHTGTPACRHGCCTRWVEGGLPACLAHSHSRGPTPHSVAHTHDGDQAAPDPLCTCVLRLAACVAGRRAEADGRGHARSRACGSHHDAGGMNM